MLPPCSHTSAPSSSASRSRRWCSCSRWAGSPPATRANTFGRAALVSFVLSLAWYVTLARFVWFLVLPWLLYVLVWLAVITLSYEVGVLRALLIALALSFLSFLVQVLFRLRPL